MNYYPFHLGDYAAHTGHLEPLEDLAYRRMLDAYYLRESPLPAEAAEVARLIRMRSNMAEVSSVLREFFTLTHDGWRHARCDEEIEHMKDKQAKARASAAASVNARRAKAQPQQSESQATAEQSLSDRSTDVELPTPTPTPTPTPSITTPTGVVKPRKRATTVPDRPEDVPEAVWTDFVGLRRAKSAPLTATALEGIRREADAAGLSLSDALAMCCARGWQGFRAAWTQQPPRASPAVPEWQQRRDIESRTAALLTGRATPGAAAPFSDFIELEPVNGKH